MKKNMHLAWHGIAAIALSIFTLNALAAKDTVSVNVHGVNHTGDTWVFSVEDPKNPKNRSGGEMINPYSGGGIQCCYDIPKVWRPGLTVKVNLIRYLTEGLEQGAKISEVKESALVEVPDYASAPGEIWVLRNPDGKMSVVSSDYQPNHPSWPGAVKGWPVPSLAFKRKKWDVYIEEQQTFIDANTALLRELQEDPERTAAEAWEIAARYQPKTLKGFSGPTDANYRIMLGESYRNGLRRSEEELNKLKKGRP